MYRGECSGEVTESCLLWFHGCIHPLLNSTDDGGIRCNGKFGDKSCQQSPPPQPIYVSQFPVCHELSRFLSSCATCHAALCYRSSETIEPSKHAEEPHQPGDKINLFSVKLNFLKILLHCCHITVSGAPLLFLELLWSLATLCSLHKVFKEKF